MMHVLDFDSAYQPVVAEGRVFFGSSADDSVYALDARTGAVSWRFTTGGPVRFAPHVAHGRCYTTSDDGFLYSIDTVTGALDWRFRAASDERQLIGNDRLISRQPCRSGALVVGDAVYVTAGMWPSEGVTIHALDVRTGIPLWCNDTAALRYLRFPHAPSLSFGGTTPQGYLLSSAGVLVVPCGKALPHGFDALTGRILYPQDGTSEGTDHNGGHWATIAGDVLFNSAPAWQPDQEPRLGEGRAVPGDGLGGYHIATGKRYWPHNASYRKLYPQLSRIRGEAWIGLIGRHRLVSSDSRLYAAGRGEIEAIDTSDPAEVRPLWTSQHPTRVYSMALTRSAVLVGGPGTLSAFATKDGKLLWKHSTSGQVRGLAISDGRVFLATERGTIAALGQPPQGLDTPQLVRPSRPTRSPPLEADDDLEPWIREARLQKGYAVVVGEEDAELARRIAAATRLHVTCLLSDREAVNAERSRLLDAGEAYGTRIAIQALDDTGRLPFPDTFANWVVSSRDASAISVLELYRILRPCGGRWVILGSEAESASELALRAGASTNEVQRADRVTIVTRGKLPDAFDWDSEVSVDHCVRWPLELQWFGGPGPQIMVNRHQPHTTLFSANGRYFTMGPRHVTAVDAYNGAVLWTRELPRAMWDRKLTADDDHVYFELHGRYCALDAQTGRLGTVYGPAYEERRFRLEDHRTFQVKPGNAYGGALTVTRTEAGLELLLSTRHPPGDEFENRLYPRDSWELGFDFRPAEERLLPEGPGAFRAVVFPDDGVWDSGLGERHELIHLLSDAEPDGTRGRVVILWNEIPSLGGLPPTDFALSARLNLFRRDGDRWAAVVSDLPLTGGEDIFGDGTATIVLDPERASKTSVQVLPLEELPDHARARREPTYVSGRVNAARLPDLGPWPARAEGFELTERAQPFTLETGARLYTRTYGCNGVVQSAQVDFFRSGTIGIYDRVDDSGVRNFAGIKSGCGICTTVAQGLFINSEGASDCTCSYSFATSFALAPARTRRNEDWALFNDRALRSAVTRQAALNLGAPGDRRDEQGLLWLHFPRQPLAGSYTIGVPCTLELLPGATAQHVNTDRLRIEGTDRPWVHGSSLVGLRKLDLNLLFYEPNSVLPALDVDRPPVVDGELEESVWGDVAPVDLEARDGMRARVFLRRDRENLYFGYEQTTSVDRRGNLPEWRSAAEGQDVDIWAGDHLDVLFRSEDGERLVHLGVAAGNGRYDATWSYEFGLPEVDGVQIDGGSEDWEGAGFPMPLPKGRGEIRLGWSRSGLLTLVRVPSDFFLTNAAWNALRVQWVNAAGRKIAETVLDLDSREGRVLEFTGALPESVDRDVPWETWRSAREGVGRVATRIAGDVVAVETLVPWRVLALDPKPGVVIGFQCVAFNPRHDDPNIRSGGGARRDALLLSENLLRLRLEHDVAVTTREAPVARREWLGSYLSYDKVEDTGWSGRWEAAARTSSDSLTFELAVPWSTLEAAGLDVSRLLVNLQSPSVRGIPRAVWGRFDDRAFALQSGELVSTPREYTLRLYFTELDDVAPGERTFDVEVNGRTVLRAIDVAREAGGRNRALVKEISGISADKLLTIELVPDGPAASPRSVPILSGLELVD